MSALSWWRSWHGAPTDHKWAVIAARSGAKVGVVSAIAWALLDYASQHIDRGTVEGFDTEEYAVYSGFSEDEIKAVIKAMTDKGIITDGRLTNWEKRQPKREDDSNERVRKFREKKRGVTQCNAPDTDTDKDTDKEREEEKDPPPTDSSPELSLYREVTGLVPDYSHVEEVERNIRAIQERKHIPIDMVRELMKTKFAEWCATKTPEGKPYNPSNPKWLEWCVTGYSPKPEKPANGKRPGLRGI